MRRIDKKMNNFLGMISLVWITNNRINYLVTIRTETERRIGI